MHNISDWELVARVQRGDIAAFAELVRRYQTPVIHFCRRMVASHQDAEDLAQESFVRLYRYIGRLRPEARFSTVLFGMVRNLTLNYLRDARRRGRDRAVSFENQPVADSPGQRPDGCAQRHEIEALLEEGIAGLSAEHREVLILREFEGLDYESIAQIVQCGKGTVKSRIARAREQLRLRLLQAGGRALCP